MLWASASVGWSLTACTVEHGLVELALVVESGAEIALGLGIVRIDSDRRRVVLEGLINVAAYFEIQAEVVVGRRAVGIVFERV